VRTRISVLRFGAVLTRLRQKATITASRTEGWNSVALRRHPFGSDGVVPGMIAATHRDPSALDRARAERLRAGIPARVAYRAGMYLLQPGA